MPQTDLNIAELQKKYDAATGSEWLAFGRINDKSDAITQWAVSAYNQFPALLARIAELEAAGGTG